MQSRPASYFTYPQLVSNQLIKADPGESAATALQTEYNDYWTLVVQYCLDFSRVIETAIRRTFVPYAATKDYYFREVYANGYFGYLPYWGGYYLDLREDLLTVDSIEFYGTALTSSQYRLVGTDQSSSSYPYTRILFGDDVNSFDTDFDSKIAIVGEWGVQDNSSDAYSDVTTLAAAVSTTTGTSLSVANGESTLFAQYQYIRIDDELMLITGLTEADAPDPDTLTVKRGVNGFTAATHDNATTIERWNVVSDVQLLAQRMVAYWFNKRDDKGDRVQVIDNALILAQFDKEIAVIAKRRQRSGIGAI